MAEILKLKSDGNGGFVIRNPGQIVSVLAGLATIYTLVIVPSISYFVLQKVDERLDRRMSSHKEQTHKGAVQTQELERVINTMNRIESKIDDIILKYGPVP